ncbi:MAG: hypothetical protein IPJ38_06710 [Dechloromonas sp.]|jgi:hypothetical protein|uniref:Uncharacterized protein n=1 Tax=Candidatus Dechloromonas phosphorivorans TaxID=2899244 RepID=A0A935MVM0_9RHOO|nr:hypothetical protein [Candidatus Dechloromonas phosphorivorans]
MLSTMIERIAMQPFMFIALCGVIILLHLGAYTRIRHEANLKNSSHSERRKTLRVMPDVKLPKKKPGK